MARFWGRRPGFPRGSQRQLDLRFHVADGVGRLNVGHDDFPVNVLTGIVRAAM